MGLAVLGLFVSAACGDDDTPFSSTGTTTDAGPDHNAPLRDATIIIDDDAPDEDAKKPVTPRGPYDAGPENFQIFDGGDIDGGIPCVQGGELEIEGNDTKGTANPIDPPSSRCGVARVRANEPADAGPDADAGDAGDATTDAGFTVESDFMTFTLSKEARDFYVQYYGDNVLVTVQMGDDGGVLDITKPGVTLPFKHNTPYFIEVKSKTGKNELWRVSVFEDK